MPHYLFSGEDKKFAFFTGGTSFTLNVTDRGPVEYISLFDLLEHFGPVTTKSDGQNVKLRINNVEGQFSNGEDHCRVGRKHIDSGARILVEDGRVMVPLTAVAPILAQYVKTGVDMHVSGRRAFLNNAILLASAELKRGDNPTLVLTFPSPVSPSISTEGNRLHMAFSRDPVVFNADQIIFQDKLIAAIDFKELNGSADFTVSGSAPLLATFSADGRTITIGAAPVAVTVVPTATTTTPVDITTQPNPSQPNAILQNPADHASSAFPAMPNGAVRFFVLIDAAHGGIETGSRFSDKLSEKDVTLAFARRLRVELQNRGVAAVLLRDGDTTISYSDRATACNAQRAGIYIAVHAGHMGTGVRVYSAMMPGIPNGESRKGSFLSWDTAQNEYLEHSRILANALADEFGKKDITSMSMSAAVPPLNNIAAPAVVIEIAPPSEEAGPEKLNEPKYQNMLAQAAASGIVIARAKMQEAK